MAKAKKSSEEGFRPMTQAELAAFIVKGILEFTDRAGHFVGKGDKRKLELSHVIKEGKVYNAEETLVAWTEGIIKNTPIKAV